MKKKRRAKKRKSIRSSRARYSKALLRAMRSRKRRKFSVSRRRIAANPAYPSDYRVALWEKENEKWYSAGVHYFDRIVKAATYARGFIESDKDAAAIISSGDTLHGYGGCSQAEAMRRGTGTVNRLTHKAKQIIHL